MGTPGRWLVFAAIAAALAGALYLFVPGPQVAPRQAAQTGSPAAALPTPAPQIQFPLPQGGTAPGLPPLDQSDSSMREQFAALFGSKSFEDFFHPKDLIRRIVATIDNLPREKLSVRLLPVKTVGGAFVTAGAEADRTIGERNAARYGAYLRMAESADTGRLVALYRSHYSLFQQAYRELGYPDGYFNDRLVEVIDHLLASPEVSAPVRIEQPKVLYQFADPELESRSAGQKILIRIGPHNAAIVKAKLREFRRGVTAP